MTQTTDGTIKATAKRKYSRNGCVECKKRRMKCDETKPKCWQCERLNRECIYILNAKNKKRRPRGQALADKIGSSSSGRISHQTSSETELVDMSTDFGFSFSDASLLYNNLNDLVNWRLEEALTPIVKSYIEEGTDPFNTTLAESFPLPNTSKVNGIVFNNPLSNFNLGEPHTRFMQRFYEDFCDLACPFGPNPDCNPLRDVLLHYAERETYLMYAILACGAQSLLQTSNSIQDDQAYCSYLSSCLNMLGENFEDESALPGNIEPMLLTILLLTTDSASSKNLRWRAHLKGAKELLKKTTIQSDTLQFCKNWLITYEVLAGITNAFGGIFQSDEQELNNFITNDKFYLISLKRLNMLDINGFNYISGHMVGLDLVFRDIIKILNKIRAAKTSGQISKIEGTHLNPHVGPQLVYFDEVSQLFCQLGELEKMFVIDPSGFINESNLNHPSYNTTTNKFRNIDTIRLSNGETVTYSWFDVAHQGHIIVARLIILTRILDMPKTSVLVQDLVKKGMHFLEFLNWIDVGNYSNNCATHLHFMIDIVGRNCIHKNDQDLAEKYLKFLEMKGLAAADHNLNRMQRIWNDEFVSDDEKDVLTW